MAATGTGKGSTAAAVLVATAIALGAAVAATYARYGSFDPCEWMEQDLAARSGLPRLAVRARIRAQFLLEGVAAPDAGQCILAWWEFRAEGVPEER